MKSEDRLVILKGQAVEATYREQDVEEYTDNPFIEALPPIFNTEEVYERFYFCPVITDVDRKKPANVRYHIIKRVKNFMQPLPMHFTIERRLSTLIRRGYLARNPLSNTFLERLQILNEIRDDGGNDHQINEKMAHIRSTADSLSIIGISGVGKTTAIEKLLLMYPQVIKHEEYKGENFSKTQIVWLKIDCPYDGSLVTLYKSFFKAVDDLLGSRYLEKFGYANRNISTMMLHMTTLASRYGIGVLVIDEIQHLLNSKNDMEEMLNFFVTLSNTVGVPTVLIGTSSAQKIFKGNFRQARRAASEGAVIWDRLSADSEEWEFFLESLWDFQCLSEITPLNDNLKNAFYDISQGITAIAVTLFILAQERAIAEEEEKITVGILRAVEKEDLHMIRPMIKALRSNNWANIMKYDDILINYDDIILNYNRDIELNGKIEELYKIREKTIELKRKNIEENLLLDLEGSGIFNLMNSHDLRKICRGIVEQFDANGEYSQLKLSVMKKAIEYENKLQSNRDKTKATIVHTDGLLALFDRARKNKKHPYEILKEHGYIKNPVDEFLKVE